MNYFKELSKKIIASVLLTTLLISLVIPIFLFQPKKSEAILSLVPVDVAQFVSKWATWVIDRAQKLYEWSNKVLGNYKDVAANYFAKKMMDYIVDQIVVWIQGGGNPKFMTDPESAFKDVADQVGGDILNKLARTDLCSADWAPKIKISLAKIPTFSTRSQCTFSKIGQKYEDFMNDFNKGGWKGWIKLTEDANNPYIVYLQTLDERNEQQSSAKANLRDKTLAGGGFLGDEVCRQLEYCNDEDGCQTTMGTWKEEDIPEDDFEDEVCSELEYCNDEDGCQTIAGTWKEGNIPEDDFEDGRTDTYECTQWEDGSTDSYECTKWETRTPGKIMADTLSDGLLKDVKWLQGKERWQAYVVAIVDAMINRLIKEGVSAITSSNPDNPNPPSQPDLMETPPKTELAAYSPWRIEIKITDSGIGTYSDYGVSLPVGVASSTIYYTLDGSEPTKEPPSDPYVWPTKVYSGPIEITSLTTLKWFAENCAGLQESTHTEYLDPAFADNPLETVAVATEPYTVALRTNKPATIYYTTDGSFPGTSSKKYIKQLNIKDISTYSSLGQMTIKWLGIDLDGIIETSHTKIASPPLPGTNFGKIGDLATPTALITALSQNSTGQSFALDPSLSSDSDKTNIMTMYEWDFDNDGVYDWSATDYNRDGKIEEYQFNGGAVSSVCVGGILSSIGATINVSCPSVASTTPAGMIMVSYPFSGAKTIRLMVTDDEGLSAETSAIVNVQ